MPPFGQPLFKSEDQIPRSQTVVVKFADGAGIKASAGKAGFEFIDAFRRPEVAAKGFVKASIDDTVKRATDLIDASRMQVEPVFDRAPDALFADALAAETSLGRVVADPNLFVSITVDGAAEAELERLVAQLDALDGVELAYVQPVAFEATIDIAPPTAPLGTPGHHEAAPDGIDAGHAWSVPGGRGSGVRIIDVEGAWRLDHEDLPEVFYNSPSPVNGARWMDEEHGTAVLGVLAAGDNGYGSVGIVPEASIGVCSWASFGFLPAALDQAAMQLSAGDVLLIEVHYPGPTTRTLDDYNAQRGFVPVEWLPAEFNAIRRAVERGVIVVQAAGNGAMNLDDARFAQRFDGSAEHDSGAIMVGAGTPRGRVPESFTNHGTRVDVHGWGSGVQTCGYGGSGLRFNGDGDGRQWYTQMFSGTSSASPIVAGAVASVQGACRAAGIALLTPREMRELLRGTGTPQAPDSRQIGPLPDLRAAMARLGLPAAASGWPTLGGPLVSAPAVESNRDGRIEVVGIVADGSLSHTYQTAPNSGWASWSAFAERPPSGVRLRGTPAIVRNHDGRLEVFALGSDMAIWHMWQTRPDGGWSGWASLGGRCTSSPAVELNTDGSLELFARWEDGSLHRNSRFVGWVSMGGALDGAPTCGHSANLRIEVFGRGPDGRLWQAWQQATGGNWSTYAQTADEVLMAADPVVGLIGTGDRVRMVLFARSVSGGIVHRWQTAPNNGWASDAGFGADQRVADGSRPAVRTDRSGDVHLFATLQSGHVAMRRTVDRAGWTSWLDLGGSLSEEPAAGVNADGRAEVFARGSDGTLSHRWAPFA